MRKNILVTYRSVSGFTKAYADMIGQELACPVLPFQDMTKEQLAACDLLIYGGRVHAGTLDGLKQVKKCVSQNPHVQLIVFASGATPNSSEQQIAEMWKQNFSFDELKNIPHMYMQSGLRYDALPFFDKLMLKVLGAMLKKKKQKSTAQQQMETAIRTSFHTPYDISSKDYILPLLQVVQSYENKEDE